jgi:hypothetical protein
VEVGQIAPLLDSAAGFEIIVRTPNIERQRYAMGAIKLGFDPELADEQTGSKSWARARSLELLDSVQRDPAEFERIQLNQCCVGTQQWSDGQDEPGRLTAALSSVAFGEVPSAPVENNWTYVIPKRLDPAQLEPARLPAFEVPSPEHIDMEDLMRRSADSNELNPPLALEPSPLASLRELSHKLDRSGDPEVRVALYNSLDQQVRLLVGDREYSRYIHALYDHFERMYLRPPEP